GGTLPDICDCFGSSEVCRHRECEHRDTAIAGKEMTFETERLDRWLVASVFFHAGLFALVIFSPGLFPAFQSNWGSASGGAGGINVKIVGSASGIPLPTPDVVQKDAPANDSPGFYKTEEAPPPPPPDKAELIPETKAPVKTTPPPKPPKPAAA